MTGNAKVIPPEDMPKDISKLSEILGILNLPEEQKTASLLTRLIKKREKLTKAI